MERVTPNRTSTAVEVALCASVFHSENTPEPRSVRAACTRHLKERHTGSVIWPLFAPKV